MDNRSRSEIQSNRYIPKNSSDPEIRKYRNKNYSLLIPSYTESIRADYGDCSWSGNSAPASSTASIIYNNIYDITDNKYDRNNYCVIPARVPMMSLTANIIYALNEACEVPAVSYKSDVSYDHNLLSKYSITNVVLNNIKDNGGSSSTNRDPLSYKSDLLAHISSNKCACSGNGYRSNPCQSDDCIRYVIKPLDVMSRSLPEAPFIGAWPDINPGGYVPEISSSEDTCYRLCHNREYYIITSIDITYRTKEEKQATLAYSYEGFLDPVGEGLWKSYSGTGLINGVPATSCEGSLDGTKISGVLTDENGNIIDAGSYDIQTIGSDECYTDISTPGGSTIYHVLCSAAQSDSICTSLDCVSYNKIVSARILDTHTCDYEDCCKDPGASSSYSPSVYDPPDPPDPPPPPPPPESSSSIISSSSLPGSSSSLPGSSSSLPGSSSSPPSSSSQPPPESSSSIISSSSLPSSSSEDDGILWIAMHPSTKITMGGGRSETLLFMVDWDNCKIIDKSLTEQYHNFDGSATIGRSAGTYNGTASGYQKIDYGAIGTHINNSTGVSEVIIKENAVTFIPSYFTDFEGTEKEVVRPSPSTRKATIIGRKTVIFDSDGTIGEIIGIRKSDVILESTPSPYDELAAYYEKICPLCSKDPTYDEACYTAPPVWFYDAWFSVGVANPAYTILGSSSSTNLPDDDPDMPYPGEGDPDEGDSGN